MNQDLPFIVIALIFIALGFTVITLQHRIDELEYHVAAVQPRSGPQGEQGAQGERGPQGEQGPPGEQGPAGTCVDCSCPSGQYITGFDTEGGLICSGPVSSVKTPVVTTVTHTATTATPTVIQVNSWAVSCTTRVVPDGMYVCTVTCPHGVVLPLSVWINGQPSRYTNADTIDYYTEEDVPDTLTCTSAGPANCGAICA